MIADTLELAQQRERDAWAKYTASQSSTDLTNWRGALNVLNGELEHRTRLMCERARAAMAGAKP